MPAPEGTPKALYDLMMICWEYNPGDRCHFDRIKKEVHLMISPLRYSYVELPTNFWYIYIIHYIFNNWTDNGH